MRAHAISWAVAVAVVVASSNIHIHMQRSSFAGAIVGAYVGGEHVSLCAAGRESVRVVREERRRHAPSPPRRDTPLLRTSPRTRYWLAIVQHGGGLVVLSQGLSKCCVFMSADAFPLLGV